MKRFFSITVILAGLGALGSVNLSAQIIPAVRVTVPFDFVAGSTTFPAGTYLIQTRHDFGSITIRGNRTETTAIVLARPDSTKGRESDTVLLFHRYGTRHFLSQVNINGVLPSVELQKSSQEQSEVKEARDVTTQVRLAAKR